MTSRSLFIFALACGLMLAGLATQSGGVIALAIPLMIYFVTGQVARPDTLRITVRRTLSAHKTTPGTPITVTLTLVNTGDRIDEAILADLLPDGLEVIEGDTHTMTALSAGQTVTLQYVVRGARGEYRFGQANIWARDAFALSQRQARVSAPAQLLIVPETSKVKAIDIRPARTHGFAGPIPTRQAGVGSDFLAVRAYQPGDRLRQINWRLSARRSEQALYTNTLEQERIADVGLILDARLARDVRTPSESLFEYSVSATGSLADTFLRAGHRVGLLVYGGGGLMSVYPAYGRFQRQRILQVLGQLTPGHHMFYESLKEIPTRFFAAQSQLVFIGPTDPDDIMPLVTLRARSYSVIVVSPNAITFERPPARSDGQTPAGMPTGMSTETPVQALALRIAQLERAHGLRQLRRRSIQVIDWDVREPFESAATSALLMPIVHQRGGVN